MQKHCCMYCYREFINIVSFNLNAMFYNISNITATLIIIPLQIADLPILCNKPTFRNDVCIKM